MTLTQQIEEGWAFLIINSCTPSYQEFNGRFHMRELKFTSTVIKKFFCFSGVGTFATALQYVILIILVQGFNFMPTLASGLGFGVSALANYWLNYQWTFTSQKRHSEALTKFFLIAASGLFINTIIMYIGTELVIFNYIVVQIIATGVVLLWNFSGNYLWTFREPGR